MNTEKNYSSDSDAADKVKLKHNKVWCLMWHHEQHNFLGVICKHAYYNNDIKFIH